MKLSAVFAVLFCASSASAQGLVQTLEGLRGTGYLGLGHTEALEYSTENFSLAKEDLPESFDWRDQGVSVSIKNQGSCGSCWAFAITKSFESALMVQRGDTQESNLSEQQQVSCNSQAYGCNGGFMSSASFVVTKGLTDEASFPYTARDTRCKAVKIKEKAYKYVLMKKPSVADMKAALVKYGYLFVTVAAGGSDWSGSRSELTRCRNRSTNHMVNIVGYKGDKFIMANSWGTKWGDDGYALIKKGCDQFAQEVGYIVAVNPDEPEFVVK